MTPREKVSQMLSSVGAVLLRAKKHQVWLLPNGKKFTRAQTPSDINSDRNNLSDLKHALGVVNESKPAEQTSRAKHRKQGNASTKSARYPGNSSMADALRSSGVEYEALTDQMRELESRLVKLERFKRATETAWWYQIAMRLRGGN